MDSLSVLILVLLGLAFVLSMVQRLRSGAGPT